jgi:hypothetical protein
MTIRPDLAKLSPPIAFIDRNMTEADGLVPAAVEFIRGFLPGGFEVGQEIRCEDEAGRLHIAFVERVEQELLFLRLAPTRLAWNVDRSVYLHGPDRLVIAPPIDQPHLPVHTNPSRWVVV